jgi:hypothetical protein
MCRLGIAAVPLAFLATACQPTGELAEEQKTAIEQAVRQQDAASGSSSHATQVESQGCLPDGSEFVQVVLSGAVEYSIEWHSDDMECGGHRNTLQFGGTPAGASSQIDLMFNIEVEEGATGTNLPARVAINDRASERHFQTSEEGGCTANVTEQSLIDENPAFRSYKLAANGHCSISSLQYSPGPGAGVSEITVGDWQIVGLAFWQGPRE